LPVTELSPTSLRRRAVHLLDSALSLILPPVCVSCRQAGSLFCDACRAQLDWVAPPVCDHCGRRLRDGRCYACRQLLPALRLRAAVWFSGPIVPAIHQFKYEGITAAAAPLADVMVQGWQEWSVPVDLVAPVALHPSRERERGYNQAALLARQLSERLALPLAARALARIRVTRPQVGLPLGERQRNVSGAFTADAALVAGKRILLVDDVCTTGATLGAAAAALLEGGASGVTAYCVARADSG
jgi:ComF family protein